MRTDTWRGRRRCAGTSPRNWTGFDPGYFVPDWDGALEGRITSTGSARKAGGFDAVVDVPHLGGRLRGRALQAHGQLAMQGDAYRGNVALALGSSRVQAHGRMTDTLEVDARFSPLQLADLLPGPAARCAAACSCAARATRPTSTADLDGSGIAYGGYRVGTLTRQRPPAVARAAPAR